MNIDICIHYFLSEVNSHLGPALFIVYDPRQNGIERFQVRWQTTPYAEEEQVVIKPAFSELIRNAGNRWFGSEPEFNNTHNTFWWIFDEE